MNIDIDKLQSKAQPRSATAIERAKRRNETHGWCRMSQDVALAIHYYLRVKDMTQKQMADKMGVSPAQVAKLVRGSENLTLETIYKISEALGEEIVHVNRPYETIRTVFDNMFSEKISGTYSAHTVAGNSSDSKYENISYAV